MNHNFHVPHFSSAANKTLGKRDLVEKSVQHITSSESIYFQSYWPIDGASFMTSKPKSDRKRRKMNVQRDWTSTICPWIRCLRLLCFCIRICFVWYGMAWHGFVLFCLQIWNYNANGLEIEKIEKWTNGKRNSGGLHAARQRCFVLTTELEERKKYIIHYRVQHARTLKWVHNKETDIIFS